MSPIPALDQLDAIAREPQNSPAEDWTWLPADLEPALNGENPEPHPTFLPRSDNRPLIYREKIHSIAAEPEAGKTKLLLQIAKEILPTEKFVMLDFETTVSEAVSTLIDLGTRVEDIRRNFSYFAPDSPLDEAAWSQIEPYVRQAAIVGIDGVTEVFALHGLNPNDGPDVAKYQAMLSKRIRALGPAVIELDHVVKSKEGQGRWATGNGHKLAGIDVGLALSVIKPFGRGVSGSSKLTIRKDRPGHLRPMAANGSKDLAVVHYTSGEDGSLRINLDPIATGEHTFRPTFLMERVSLAIEETPGLTKNGIRLAVNGRNDAKDTALSILVEEGFVKRAIDGQAHRHLSNKPYREAQE